MTLMARFRPSILFVAATALVFILTGVPAVAKDGSVPARPTGLSTVATHQSVTLIWNSPDDDSITHYKVLRREPKAHAAYGFVAIEDDTGSAATRYTDDTVRPGKRYIYRVKAVNPHGVSAVSRHAKAITPAAPAPEPTPLTAGFVAMPAEHDGENGIRFRVAFSENIGISFRALREDAFTVSGGRVTGGRRVDGRRDLFEMTVRPDSVEDVTIALPAGRECGVSGAICTKGKNRRQLTNTPTATVAGPEVSHENSPATGAPTIAGTAQVGATLMADISGIADADGLNSPTFTYQWVSCGGPTDVCILGAEDSTYILVADDAGKTIKVLVYFTDDAGNAESLASDTVVVSSTSAQQDENTPATGAPTIAGTAQVGETLTAQTSGIADADGLSNPTFTYQWVSCGGPTDVCILGATDSTYTLVAEDEGKTIKVLVYFTDDASNPESLASDTVVVPSTSAQQEENSPATGAPTIAGTAQMGETLTAETSGIADADGLSNPNFTYQWVSCGGPTDVCILGATDSTYTVVAADAGKSIKVIVSFTDDADNPETLSSNVAAVSSTPQQTEGLQPPGAPGMPKDSLTYHVEDGQNWVTFRWTRASGVVDGYEVLRGQNSRSEFEGKVVARIDDPNVTSYEDHTVIESSDYFFAVRAFNSAGTSGLVTSTACRFLDSVIAEGSQGLAYPDNLTARLTENGTAIVLTWTEPTRGYHGQDVSPATGYQILRWDVKRGYPNYDILVDNTGSTATSYVDRDITPNNTFIYQVRAWNDWGLGDRSFGATVKTMDLDVIGAPRNFRVSSSSEGAALTWDAPEGVADTDLSYRIYRREHSGATVPLVLLASDHGATSYTDGTVVPGTEYHYQVRVDGDPLGSQHGIPTKLRYGRYLAPQDLSVAPVAPDADPAALSVADARAREGTDETIDFAVSLSRAASGPVSVTYATADGTATAGSDYTRASGKLRFAPGETEKTISVPVLDDAHDEGEETMQLRLSAASGAVIADGVATGTIENTDHMPAAWLARFGRTLAGQVVDAIGRRMEGGGAGTHVRVGGMRFDASGAFVQAGDEDEPRLATDTIGWTDPADASSGMTGRELLLGSSFALGAGGANGTPAWTGWGRFATHGFEADVDGTRLDGNVTTGFVGADMARDGWLAGIALSYSTGDGDFSLIEGDDEGSVENSLTALYPYAKLGLGEKVDVWGLAGLGSGDLTLTLKADAHRATDERYTTDIDMRMGALGLRGEVVSAKAPGGLAVNVKSDAFWVRMDSDAVASEDGRLRASRTDASRVRLVLEGSRAVELDEGTLTPSLELGLRHDGGDAETGTGLEAGAGLRYAAGALTIGAQVRTLVAHEDSGYEEWGVSGSVRLAPDASGRGLSLKLAPVWGAPSSGVEHLWSARDAGGLVGTEDFEAGRRLEAELGYGIALSGTRGLLTPYTALSWRQDGARTHHRTGARWQLARAAALGLEWTHEPGTGAKPPANALMLRTQVRW